MSELVFYTNPQSRGRVVHWMLEEVGQPYQTIWLQYGPEMKSAEYRAVNPMGKVPAVRHGDVVVTEDDPGHEEFTHTLCARWEQLALKAQSERTRVCLLRTGVVLAREGGALSKMKLPFKLGVGGPIGSGQQYLPWIHVDDLVNAILWLIDNDQLQGPFNMVAPYAVRNEQFAATLGQVMHRPAFMRTPASAIKLMMGESAVLVLGGQHVLPKRLEESGFGFRWYDLQEALQDVAG